MSASFVEAEGLIHMEAPHLGEFTLCGDAFDLDSDLPGYERRATVSKTITCPVCAAIIVGCRGVRVDVKDDQP